MYDVAAGLIRAGHRVTVLAINTPKHDQPADALSHLGPNLRLVTVDVDTRLSPVKALRNLLFSALPYNIERFLSDAVATRLAELMQEDAFDVVQMEGSFVALYATPWLEARTGTAATPELPPLVLRAHNIEYSIWEMLASRTSNPLKKFFLSTMARRLKQYELEVWQRFDAVAAITEADQQRLRRLGCHEPVVFIPAGVNLDRFQPNPALQSKPRTLFMIGSLDWLPNQEGLDWFLAEVWPRVHALYPDLEFHLAGKEMPVRFRQLQLPGVTVHGFVESAAVFMEQYEVMLVPLLSGGGMRIKIIEGMALSKCILSTTLGAEGIHVRDDHDILVRDTPAAWVDAIGRYYHGQLPANLIGREAANTIARLYDNRRVVESFLDLYSVVQQRRVETA